MQQDDSNEKLMNLNPIQQAVRAENFKTGNAGRSWRTIAPLVTKAMPEEIQ